MEFSSRNAVDARAMASSRGQREINLLNHEGGTDEI